MDSPVIIGGLTWINGVEKAGWSAPAASRLPSPREKAVIPRVIAVRHRRRAKTEREPG
jgi:hypothetical protein